MAVVYGNRRIGMEKDGAEFDQPHARRNESAYVAVLGYAVD